MLAAGRNERGPLQIRGERLTLCGRQLNTGASPAFSIARLHDSNAFGLWCAFAQMSKRDLTKRDCTLRGANLCAQFAWQQ
jgi:hypothetical protein